MKTSLNGKEFILEVVDKPLDGKTIVSTFEGHSRIMKIQVFVDVTAETLKDFCKEVESFYEEKIKAVELEKKIKTLIQWSQV